jgi:hypothetical protein
MNGQGTRLSLAGLGSAFGPDQDPARLLDDQPQHQRVRQKRCAQPDKQGEAGKLAIDGHARRS